MSGKLYICATPIGNLSDITIRTLDVLNKVDIIAAEDTRRTMKLLNAYEIKKPVTSYYEHNKAFKSDKLISLLEEGKNLALVSDAGTPLISDPGDMLVSKCIERGIEVESLPGPCAAICAMTLSGLDSRRFYFYGFLPAAKNEKRKELEKLSAFTDTIIFYEAPHKLKATLSAMLDTMGNRRITIHRELTKKFEENIRVTLEESNAIYEENEPRGEYVLILEGADEELSKTSYDDIPIEEHVLSLIEEGLDKKQAIKKCAELRNIPKREVYNIINRE